MKTGLSKKRKPSPKSQKIKSVGKSYFEWYVIAIGLLLFALTIYIGYRIQISDRRLIPISVLALIAGIIFEGKRISDNWGVVLLTALGALVLSFIAFLPGKRERYYDFENHIQAWPYYFVVIFALISIITHGEKVTPKLTEGITLMQSVAVIYWVVDHDFTDTKSIFLISLMLVGLCFCLYSVFHAFSYTILTRKSRLTLSIWSCIIATLFAIDNIYKVYKNELIEDTTNMTDGFVIGLQSFLLGVSCIYIIQNYFMLAGFLPGKGSFFNRRYFHELREHKEDHIKRYSYKQVNIQHSFFCVFFTGTLFALNYHFRWLPGNMAIWVMFVVFPLVLMIFDRFILKGRA